MGTFGSGLASTLTNSFVTLSYYGFCKFIKDENFKLAMSVPLLRKENLSGYLTYIKLGLPGALIMMIDWGSYEILSLWSAAFGVKT